MTRRVIALPLSSALFNLVSIGRGDFPRMVGDGCHGKLSTSIVLQVDKQKVNVASLREAFMNNNLISIDTSGAAFNPKANRAADLRLALLLTYITLGWMIIEGAGSLILGWVSKSLLLEAFGIDSVVELFSAGVLLWRLRVEAGGKANEERIESVETRAARLVGYSLFVIAAYVAFNSAFGLFFAHRVTDTHESVWGIAIGLVAKIGMPILASYKLKVAARLNSRALRADAMEAITCGYLSIVLMVGLAATRLLGWWWLDSVAALALIPFLIKEGRAALNGGCDCCSGETETKGK